MSTPAVAGGDGPNPIAVSPDGKSVYVANQNANGAGGISVYESGAGASTSVTSSAFGKISGQQNTSRQLQGGVHILF